MAVDRAVGRRPLGLIDITVYLGGLIVGVAMAHVVIGVVEDGRMTAVGGLMLSGVGLFIAAFMYVRRAAMMQRQYAYYILHVLAFLVVNASFALHTLGMYAADRDGEITDSWQGVLFTMPLFWSIGLFVHTLATVFSTGYEHVEV